MGYDRFLNPTLPFFAILWLFTLNSAELFIKKIISSVKIKILIFFLASAIVFLPILYKNRKIIKTTSQYTVFLNNNHGKIGAWLKKKGRESWLVAASDVGLSFYIANNVNVIDLMGLNDYYIAKLPGKWVPRELSPKSDAGYIFNKNPEIIILRGNDRNFPLQKIEKDLLNSENFTLNYRFLFSEKWLHVFPRKDIFQKLNDVK